MKDRKLKYKISKVFKKKKEDQEETKLSNKEKNFLLSLYPKGRHVVPLLKQLKEKFKDTNEATLKNNMTKWIKKLRNIGYVGISDTDRGQLVALTRIGIEYVRIKINKMFKKKFDKFVETVNKLIKVKDPWAVDMFKDRAQNMVNSNLHLYTVIFHPCHVNNVVENLETHFDVDLENTERKERFKKVITMMSKFGLIRVEETGNGAILESTNFAKSLFSDALKKINEKFSKGKKE